MASESQAVVSGDEGVSPAATAEAEFPEGVFTDSQVVSTESQPGEIPEGDGASTGSEQPDLRLPPELRPDKDGNPPQLTEALMRKLRGKYFTVKHPVLANCGHKMDQMNEPRTNCQNCWFQWLNTHPQLVEVADQFYRTQGKGPITAMRGAKFVKMFGRYMATVIRLMNEEKQNVVEDSKSRGDEVVPSEGEVTSSSAGTDQG